MRRFATGVVLAAPLLLAGAGTAAANGPCTYGYGCGGFCMRLFPHIHQHGPLYNYGPYYGYPPFEPYGYWNPYLQYTGPVGPPYGGGGHGHQWGHNLGRLNPHPLFLRGHSCQSCGHHHIGSIGSGDGRLHHGFHRHHAAGCTTCGQAAAEQTTTGDAFARYSGHGEPEASAAYYVGAPALTDPEAVVPAGYFGR